MPNKCLLNQAAPRRWGRTPYSKGIVLSGGGCGEALRPVTAWSTALWMARDPAPSPKVPLLESPLDSILADFPSFARAQAQARVGACPGDAVPGQRLWNWGLPQWRRSGALTRAGRHGMCRWGMRIATTCNRPCRQRGQR